MADRPESSAPVMGAPQVLRIIWFAMLGAVAIYAAIALSVSVAVGQPLDPIAVKILTAVACVAGVMSLITRFALLSPASIAEKIPEAIRDSRDDERLLHEIGKVAFAPLIASFALAESVAIVGFALALLGGDPEAFIPFGAAALMLLWMNRPELTSLVSRVREQPVRRSVTDI